MCVVNVYGHVRNAYMHMCVYMPVRLYVCAGIYKKTFEHLQAYIHTHIQRHIHTYMHTYNACIHTYIHIKLCGMCLAPCSSGHKRRRYSLNVSPLGQVLDEELRVSVIMLHTSIIVAYTNFPEELAVVRYCI